MRTCTICAHPKRQEIDKALVCNESLRSIACRTGTSHTSLARHRNKCLSTYVQKAKEIETIDRAAELVDDLKKITEVTRGLLAQAVQNRDIRTALSAIARLEKQLALRGQLLGELNGNNSGPVRIEVVYDQRSLHLHGQGQPTALAGQDQDALPALPAPDDDSTSE